MKSAPDRLLLAFTVDGDPRSKVTHGRFKGKHSQRYEQWVRFFAHEAMRKKHLKPFSGPLELTVRLFLKRPKKPKDPNHPVTRPDLKNLVANIEDALDLADVFDDDAQIVRYGHGTGKYYCQDPAPEGRGPRVEIEVRVVGKS